MAVDILNLSDEELMKLDPSTLDDLAAEAEAAADNSGSAVEVTDPPDAGEGQGDAGAAGDEGAEAA